MQFQPMNHGLFVPQAYLARVKAEQMRREKLRKTAAGNLQREVTRLIQENYPEHLFMVEVRPETGDIFIDHMLLKHAGARYYCSYQDFAQSNGWRVVKLAGEILERVNMSRSELLYYEDYDDSRVVALSKTEFKKK